MIGELLVALILSVISLGLSSQAQAEAVCVKNSAGRCCSHRRLGPDQARHSTEIQTAVSEYLTNRIYSGAVPASVRKTLFHVDVKNYKADLVFSKDEILEYSRQEIRGRPLGPVLENLLLEWRLRTGKFSKFTMSVKTSEDCGPLGTSQ